MQSIENFLKMNLIRRDVIRWLMKVASTSAVFTLFGGGTFRKSKAGATQSAQQTNVPVAEGQLTIESIGNRRQHAAFAFDIRWRADLEIL